MLVSYLQNISPLQSEKGIALVDFQILFVDASVAVTFCHADMAQAGLGTLCAIIAHVNLYNKN